MALFSVCAIDAWGQGDADPKDSRANLIAALREQGVELDFEVGAVSIAAEILERDGLLEYLLVGPRGAGHESLFGTQVGASAIHTAMLLMGFAPGANAQWIANPMGAQIGARRPSFDVLPPEHAAGAPGVHLYAGWRRGDEVYFYRIEDLIADLSTGAAMRRHGWVYLGSKEIPPRGDQPGGFAADLVGNLISVCFFAEGQTLATAALPECLDQTIWTANPWLLPERGQPVRFVLARAPVAAPSPALIALLPDLGAIAPTDNDE